jgi:protein SCO1/2
MPSFVRAILILYTGLLVLGIGMGGWWYLEGSKHAERRAQGATSGVAAIGGPFALVDQEGRPRTSADFQGSYMLVYFGYTYCPDVCPTGLQNITLALDLLAKQDPDKAAKVVPIFITIDPERDTPAVLAAYAANFHPRLVALTGTLAQTSQAAKNYRVYYKKILDEGSAAYLMDHSSFIYLMDPTGAYVSHYTHLTRPEEIAKSLEEQVTD